MQGGVFPASVSEGEARELIEAHPPMLGCDLARSVTPAEVTVLPATEVGRQANLAATTWSSP